MLTLLTGATGNLGAEIALEVLRNHTSDIRFVVRSDSPQHGLTRLKRTLATHVNGCSDWDYINALSEDNIICGDVSTQIPNPRDFDLVISCGAITPFNDPTTYKVNCIDTLNFHNQFTVPTKIVQLGTAYACGRQKPNAFVTHGMPVGEQFNLYTKSKAAMQASVNPDVVVVRPSIIMGHSVLGCKPSASLFWLLPMMREIGGFTMSLERKIDIVPVNFVARGVLDVAFGNPKHKEYFLTAGTGASYFRDILFGCFGSTEWYKQYTVEDLCAKISAMESLAPHEKRMYRSVVKGYAELADLGYTFDNSRYVEEFNRVPTQFHHYVHLCRQSVEGVPVSQQMLPDVASH